MIDVTSDCSDTDLIFLLSGATEVHCYSSAPRIAHQMDLLISFSDKWVIISLYEFKTAEEYCETVQISLLH